MGNGEFGMSEMQGKKLDQNKPRMSLLPKGALNAVIRVLEFGAKKYTIVDFHDTIIIGKTIEERLWSSMRNVSSAEGTKESSLKVAVQNATVRSTIRYLHALAVEKKNLSQQKMENVVLATSLSDLPSVLWNLKLDKNINKLTEAHLSSENKNANVIANDVAIPNAEKNDSEILNNETLRDTDLPYKSMNIFVSEGALSAEVQNVHTLTTTITQGSSVTSFAVSAIKLLDCYKTLLILLEHYYSISINISELGEVKRGVDNWKHVPEAKTRYYDAMQRHIDAWWHGEQKDPETGEHHLAHAICCGMFLWWFDSQQSGVPEAILEAEKKPCHHHWVDGLDGGTMVCAHKCGAWK